MKVLIQKVIKNNKLEFANVNTFQLNEGFTSLGYEIDYFTAQSLDKFDLGTDIVVVGGIPIIDKVYEKLEIKNPYLADYPWYLRSFLGREIKQSTIKQVRDSLFGKEELEKAVFIKPLPPQRKSFTGHLIYRFNDLLVTAHLPEDTKVQVSEYVDFVSEYRVFIYKQSIIDIRRYSGNCLVQPSINLIVDMVNKTRIEHGPRTYALDVGVTQDGRTLLVEMNDANALGGYGLPAIHFARMVEDRWEEIVRQ